MLPTFPLGDKIFRWLVEIDEATCRRVAAAGCRSCGGPLHRGDYPRKPRGGLDGAASVASGGPIRAQARSHASDGTGS